MNIRVLRAVAIILSCSAIGASAAEPRFKFITDPAPHVAIAVERSGDFTQSFSFFQGGQAMIVLRADGQIEIGKGVKPDAAAAAFIAQIRYLWGQQKCPPQANK